jgi:lincosamide nucleotidyltransferase A/C/D/E
MKNAFFPKESVVALYKTLEKLSINVWLDGGWGVDALLGSETRTHQDLDIIIQEKYLPKFFEFLKTQHYTETHHVDASAWNFVLANDKGHEIDVHVITFDDKGNGLYGPSERGVFYPADALKGKGHIAGTPVSCLTATYQVLSHSGYELKEKDFKDILALCQKFNIPLPSPFPRKT